MEVLPMEHKITTIWREYADTTIWRVQTNSTELSGVLRKDRRFRRVVWEVGGPMAVYAFEAVSRTGAERIVSEFAESGLPKAAARDYATM